MNVLVILVHLARSFCWIVLHRDYNRLKYDGSIGRRALPATFTRNKTVIEAGGAAAVSCKQSGAELILPRVS